MAKVKVDRFYVSLDVLLDTRIGTLAKMGSPYAEEIRNNGYLKRRVESFEGVDMDAFRKAYAARDVETLKYSVVTEGIRFLRDLAVEIQSQQAAGIASDPNAHGIEVIVNVHPYDLSEDEQNAIADMIDEWLMGIAEIKTISLPVEKLTVETCMDFSALLMYDYNEWMDHPDIVESFRRNTGKLAKTHLFAPGIFFVQEPTEEEMDQLGLKGMNPLEATEYLASPLIHLELLDVRIFSILTP